MESAFLEVRVGIFRGGGEVAGVLIGMNEIKPFILLMILLNSGQIVLFLIFRAVVVTKDFQYFPP